MERWGYGSRKVKFRQVWRTSPCRNHERLRKVVLEMDFNESGGGGGGKGTAGGAKITAYVERCQPTMCNSNRGALTGKRSRYFSLLICRSATLLQSAVYLLSLEWCIDSSESGRFEDSPAWVHFIPLYLPFLSIEEQSYLLPYFSLDSWKFWKLVQSLFFPEILKIPICKFLEFLNNLLHMRAFLNRYSFRHSNLVASSSFTM